MSPQSTSLAIKFVSVIPRWAAIPPSIFFSIFKDKSKALQVCINRFDDETKQAFLELYDKVDAEFELPNQKVVELPKKEN